MLEVQKHMALLGLRVKDKVTGVTGVVAGINFDLYGCIQANVTPGMDKDGKPKEPGWYDVARLQVLDKKPVMDPPNYEYGPVAEGRKGAAEKPAVWKA
jgi:ribosomal protein S6E (S10)